MSDYSGLEQEKNKKTVATENKIKTDNNDLPEMLNQDGDMGFEVLEAEELQDFNNPLMQVEAINSARMAVGLNEPLKKSEEVKRKREMNSKIALSKKMKNALTIPDRKSKDGEDIDRRQVIKLLNVLLIYDTSKLVKKTDEQFVNDYRQIYDKVLNALDTLKIAFERGTEEKWLDEDDLLVCEAKLKTLSEIKRMNDARAKLIQNRYYLLLNEQDTQIDTKENLIARLRKELEKNEENRNQELIEYYENRIRLIDNEDLAKGNVEKVTEKHRRELKEEKEKQKRKDAYKEQVRKARLTLSTPFVRKNVDISASVKRAMKKHTLTEDVREEVAKDHVTEEQQEGIDLVLAWMKEVCNKGSRSYEGFFLKIMKYPKRELLAAFYILEKDKFSTAVKKDVAASQAPTYVPDLNAVKSALRPGLFGRFMNRRRKGSDYSWDKLSSALEIASKSSDLLKLYEEITTEEERVTKDLHENRQNEFDLGPNAEKLSEEQKKEVIELKKTANQRDRLFKMVMTKSTLLQIHMESQGLTPEMPVDLVEDPKMRELITKEFAQTKELIRELVKVDSRLPGKKDLRIDESLVAKKPVSLADDTNGKNISTLDSVGDGMDGVSFVADRTQNVFDLMGDSAKALVSYGVSGIVGGTADFFHTIYAFRKVYESLGDEITSTRRKSSQAIFGVGRAIRLFGNVGRQYSYATRAFLSLSASTNNLIYGVSGGVFGVGALIEAVGMGKKVIDCEKEKGIVTKAQEELLTVPKNALSKDHKKLGVFLKHRKVSLNRQEATAAISCVISTTHAVSGSMMTNAVTLGASSIVKTVADLSKPILCELPNYFLKKRERNRLVDEYLNLDKLVEEVKGDHPRTAKRGKFREKVRTEAINQLGFNGKEALYKHIVGQMADTLYNKVYLKEDGSFYTESDYEQDLKNETARGKEKHLFIMALKSLGIKPSLPKSPDNPPIVTTDILTARIMEG